MWAREAGVVRETDRQIDCQRETHTQRQREKDTQRQTEIVRRHPGVYRDWRPYEWPRPVWYR